MNRICCICGDKAIGNNFGAMTCESCKAFFRRTAVKSKDLKCLFDDNCNINVITRKFCQKCRLKKCLSKGMKKDSILNENQKESMRRRIEENKRKRKISNGSTSSVASSTDSTGGSCPESATFSHKCSIDSLSVNLGNNMGFDIKCNSNETIDNIIERNLFDYKIRNSEVVPIHRPLTDYYNNFCELEGNKLSELLNAVRVITDPPPKSVLLECSTPTEMMEVLKFRFDRDIRHLIEFTKNLTAFNTLCCDDQIVLIKYGCLGLSCMRGILHYNFEAEEWDIYIDENTSISMKLSYFKPSRRGLYAVYKEFLTRIATDWDFDPMIINLLTAILLFNTNLPEVCHKDVIKRHQKTYMYLLRRYLLLKYRSEFESNTRFQRLIGTLKDINILGSIMKLNGSERKDLNPFLTEIFDAQTNQSIDIQ